MPDFKRVLRSLELELAKDDPIQLASLSRKYQAQDRRQKRFALVLAGIGIIYLAAFVADQVSAQDCRDIFQGCETIVLDEDEPDQDPVYDEDDPVYDEMDDNEDD